LISSVSPGPRGHVGQVIVLDHGQNIGADLSASSLTDMVVHGQRTRRLIPRAAEPIVAYVNTHRLASVEAAAHPALEVLGIGWWDGEPFRLVPVVGLPRLRTLTAFPRTLADPLEVAKLTGMEFLELGPADWRVLLDAGAVPRTLLAAAIAVHGEPNPLPIVDLANELLALWDRPRSPGPSSRSAPDRHRTRTRPHVPADDRAGSRRQTPSYPIGNVGGPTEEFVTARGVLIGSSALRPVRPGRLSPPAPMQPPRAETIKDHVC
jgi:hypothetical protein